MHANGQCTQCWGCIPSSDALDDNAEDEKEEEYICQSEDESVLLRCYFSGAQQSSDWSVVEGSASLVKL
jgi:hypothetical protein